MNACESMNARERVKRALNFTEPDRVPIEDTVWVSTLERWRKEGLPADVSPADYFDYDIARFGPDPSPQLPTRTIREDKDHVIETTPYGGVTRNRKDYASVPDFLEFPVATREDWDKVKERLVPHKGRVDWEGEWPRGFAFDSRQQAMQAEGRVGKHLGLPGCQRAREAGKFVLYAFPIGFGHIHQAYIGTQDLLIAVATDPDWVIDMYETNADLCMGTYEVMVEGGFEFDGVFFNCDLGYNKGPFFSPRHYEQQVHPTFARLFSFFRDKGLPVIFHTDGRVLDLIPYFIEEGVSCLHPLEVKAGLDLVELKQQYRDKLAFFGGIDVRAMAADDPAVIEKEISTKVPVAMEGGGYLYHSDHSVPDDVSFEQYQRVMDLMLEYGTY